jgi:hypothetical protein
MELAGASGYVDRHPLAILTDCARDVAVRWSSPRSPLTFTCRQAGLRGLPERASPLMLLASPTETQDRPVLPLERGSSLGIRTSPSPAYHFARQLPAGLQTHLRPPGTIRRGHVPPSRFLFALVVFSEREPRVCCAPQPVLGSTVFQGTFRADQVCASSVHPRR